MKISHRGGHSFNCRGAKGFVDEYDQMQGVYRNMDKLFRDYRHTTINCNSNANTPNSELREGASIANKNNADLYLSYHMNATPGGYGVEVWVHSPGCRAEARAKKVCENLSELGFRNRGVKYNKNLYEMKGVNAPNMIIEFCFLDSQKDIDLWNSLSWDQITHAVANAIDSNIPKKPPVVIQEDKKVNILYQAHVQDKGWLEQVSNGDLGGTTGEYRKMEALAISITNYDKQVEIQGHIEDIGWQSVKGNGEVIGTVGLDKRLEAIKINAEGLNITYRAHVEKYGWLNWVSNGEVAGTVGEGKRLEAVEIKII